jgi:hypothetical protein
MATIGRANNASYLNTARLSYISTAPFNNNFFTYTTTVNSQGTTVGVFTPVSGATAANCPAARVLRETGRKLYPGANPMPSGYNTYMVSVYDQQTQLTGFIDPNSSVWCIYNNDKPNFWADGVDPTSQVTDQGLSIYTLGNVTSQGFISTASYLTVAGNALVVGNTSTLGSALVAGNLSTIGSIVSGANINARTYISSGTSMSAYTTMTAGKFATSPYLTSVSNPFNAGSASSGSVLTNGSTGVVVNTTACTTNSLIFATLNISGAINTGVYVYPPSNGTFTIYTAGATAVTCYWFIIN